MEWIKCSDKMPEPRQYVDILCDEMYRKTDYEHEGDGIFYNNEYDKAYSVGTVTHRMPVPPLPPKE